MARINRKYTFTVVEDVYTEARSKDGVPIRESTGQPVYKLVKKNATWEIDFYVDDIVGVSHIISKKGNVRTDVCKIMHRDKGDWTVLGSKKVISDIVFGNENDSASIGFISKPNKKENED